MRKEDCYFLGKITRKHGLQGNVLLKLDTDQPELYDQLESVFIELNGLLTPFFIQKTYRSKDDVLNLLFKNTNEQMIEQLLGKNVFLPLSTLPKLEGKQFYYHEVIGFSIKDEKDRDYGVIKEINDLAAQPYFILQLNGKEINIPIIKDWIIEVNREQKTITMELPEGLLEVFTEGEEKNEDSM